MTKSLPHSRHPSTPLRMTTFVVLSNLLLRQPLEACPLVEWACQFLEKLGHEAVIIDARQAKAVVRSKRKTDKIDAHKLALLRVWDEVTRELHELTQRLEREVTQDKLCRHLMSAEEFEKETCWLKKD